MSPASLKNLRVSLSRARPFYDVVIIGGGINGSGIARELALRNFKVALFEKNDFASGTSSASSKLIHGGLRYLEHYRFRFVAEACREREFLLKNAPHLVRPLPFLIPLYKGGIYSPLKIRSGLWLYDAMSLFHAIQRHQWLSLAETLEKEPLLKKEGLLGSAMYYDAQMDDARLCLEAVLQAKEFGAHIWNYAEVIQFHHNNERVESVTIQDTLNGERRHVSAKLFINASGPWTDRVLVTLTPSKPDLIRPSKGIHLVTRKLTHDHALLLTVPQDQRVFFVIPWYNYSLIGTTDTDFKDDITHVNANAEDVAYLLAALQAFFPKEFVNFGDIWSTFAGLRPLIQNSQAHSYHVSREHRLIQHKENIWSLIGGKFTTFRAIAEEVAHAVIRKFGLPPQPSLTKTMPFLGGYIRDREGYIETHYPIEGPAYNVSKELYQHLVKRYGSCYSRAMKIISERPEYAMPLGETRYYIGDVVYAVRHEMAVRVSDFLRRRTPLMLEKAHARDCVKKISDIFQEELGWNENQKKQEMDRYFNECDGMSVSDE